MSISLMRILIYFRCMRIANLVLRRSYVFLDWLSGIVPIVGSYFETGILDEWDVHDGRGREEVLRSMMKCFNTSKKYVVLLLFFSIYIICQEQLRGKRERSRALKTCHSIATTLWLFVLFLLLRLLLRPICTCKKKVNWLPQKFLNKASKKRIQLDIWRRFVLKITKMTST